MSITVIFTNMIGKMVKRFLFLYIQLLFPLMIFAQASGGQIRRNNTTTTTVKKQKKPNLPPNSVKLDDGTIVKYETTQAVDLGLPSGTIWAGWNIGANTPFEVGSYYAWGETEEKEVYDWNTYFDIESVQKTIFGDYVNPSFKKYHVNSIMSIIGSDHDVAKVKWGESWQMPSKKQIDELVEKCKVFPVSLPNKSRGVVFIGPNGKALLFPNGGEIFKNEKRGYNLVWCGELRPYAEASTQNSYFAYHLGWIRVFSEGFRCYGMNVRAVMK